MTHQNARECDVAVIGGGLVGCSIAWGLARSGQRVTVLDEGDVAYRASRGNFALVWVHSKGLGMPQYSAWTMRSSEAWREFADALQEQSGIGVAFERPGGFNLSLSQREWEARRDLLQRIQDQPHQQRFEFEMLDRERVKAVIPQIGPEVVGASYSKFDGHCNPLAAFGEPPGDRGADEAAADDGDVEFARGAVWCFHDSLRMTGLA